MKNKLIILVLVIILILGGLFAYLAYRQGKITPFAQSAQVSLTLDPASGSYNVGQVFPIKINFNSAGKSIDGVDISYLHYNPAYLEIQDSNTSAGGVQIAPGSIFPSYLGNNVDTTNGTIFISGIVSPGSGSGYNGSGVFATVNVKALKAGTTSLYFDFTPGSTTDTNAVEHSTNADVLSVAGRSDLTLTTVPATVTVDLKVDGSNGPVTKNVGESARLTWSSQNATSCTASGGWTGGKQTSGEQTLSNLQSSNTYTLECRNSDNTIARDTVAVNVVNTQKNPPSVNIKANDNDGPIEIDKGTAVTLSWTSERATKCTASGDWSGDKSTSGSESTGNLDSAKTYNLSCQNSDGSTSDNVTVNVKEVAPQPAEEQPANQENPPQEEANQNTENQTQNDTTNQTAAKPAENKQQQTTVPAETKKQEVAIKNNSYKSWTLWFFYAVIPAFLAGVLIYIILRRRGKKNGSQETLPPPPPPVSDNNAIKF